MKRNNDKLDKVLSVLIGVLVAFISIAILFGIEYGRYTFFCRRFYGL